MTDELFIFGKPKLIYSSH